MSLTANVFHEGMTLKVVHLTRFLYHGEVLESHNEARLCPISDPMQRCASFELKVTPSVNVITRRDFFLNRVDYFDVMRPHDSLEIESTAVVETRAEMRGPVPTGLTLHSLDSPEVDVSVFEYQVESQLIRTPVSVMNEAREVMGEAVTDLWWNAVAIGRHIYATFDYVPGATDSRTPVADALAARRGVCQDFANVMIAMCRSRGIPARYVSGYFYNGKTGDENEASHAWVEIYLPHHGWKAWDPTHAREADPRYIKLAIGRDYGDIKPVSGAFRGKGSRHMAVTVQVRQLA